LQGTYLCDACAKHYFQTISDRRCQSCASLHNGPKEHNGRNASGSGGDSGGASTEEIGWALLAFALVVLCLTVLVFIIACQMGGDRSTGLSRASSFLFYSLVSVQLIAQIGAHATGFEDPVVLRLYWWLSVLSTIDTAESMPTACSDGPPFFWSNATMVGALSLLCLWLCWMYVPHCRLEHMCGNTSSCCKQGTQDTLKRKVTPALRRYTLATMILMYAVVAKTSVEAIHCIDNGNGTMVLSSNYRVECWQNEHHYFNGMLGWCTLIMYCMGLPLFCGWLVSCAPWFNHAAKKNTTTTTTTTTTTNEDTDPKRATRGSVVNGFMTAGEKERMRNSMQKSKQWRRRPEQEEQQNIDSTCCAIHDLGTIRARQRSSVLLFVHHRPNLYISYKPLIECDYHIHHLYFRPAYLILLLVLASLDVIPAEQSVFRLIVGGVCLLLYIGATFVIKPMRRTRNWKLPVKLLIVVIGLLALSLNYVSGLLDENGEHWHNGIQILSFAVIILTGLLICIVIPLSAVYELWIGARREKKCQWLREQYMKRKNIAGDISFAAAAAAAAAAAQNGGEEVQPRWEDMMGMDDYDELKSLIQVLEEQDHDMLEGQSNGGAHGGTPELMFATGLEMTALEGLGEMMDNPLQQEQTVEQNVRVAAAAAEAAGHSTENADANNRAHERAYQRRLRGSAPGWDSYADDTTGSTYYYNPKSRVSVWSMDETWDESWVVQDDAEAAATEAAATEAAAAAAAAAAEHSCSSSSSSSSSSSESSSSDEEEQPVEKQPVEQVVEVKSSAGRANASRRKMKKIKVQHQEQSSELDAIRQRILANMSINSSKGYHVRKASLEGVDDVGAIEINDKRGDWMMIHDELSNQTLYYNDKTNELRTHRPSNWVRILTQQFTESSSGGSSGGLSELHG